ncbi:phage tail protein [Ralstonia pseudosolanacearum]|uniref:phage tail protein n=1 Tax=Ralstonia pseudosolanacearum TaxID=1310165 RepID=UPI001FFA2E97|nr:phage tail protein [Ralstonia pseudosolanacearum]MDC6286808.1 phage tail protein [Ralstonia pseudosolanacearum]
MTHENRPLSLRRSVAVRSTLLAGAIATLLSLTGCGLSSADRAAASVGFGDTISEKTLNNMARPPKQVVYRFDDHRYIENDPGPGYNLPCQAELFYVDEQLGIRTQVGGNSKHNPEGLFKVVNSPYVVTRSDASVRVSFDQGRTFRIIPNVDGSTDVLVVGDKIYMGGGSEGNPIGAFTSRTINLLVIKPDEQRIEPQYTARKPLNPDQVARLARSNFPVPEPDPRYAELKNLAREHVVNSWYQDPAQYFTCRRDLPWRPSINRERQLQTQQNPSTVNASPTP